MKSDEQIDVFIAAKSKEHFLDMSDKLNLDWDYNSLED